MHCRTLITLLLCLQLIGCVPLPTPNPFRPSAATPTRGLSPEPRSLPSVTPTWTPSAIASPPATATPTETPTAEPTPMPAPTWTPTATAQPAASLDEWGIYALGLRAAMQPEPPWAGMTQYSLTLTLAPDLRQLDGRARIRYSNQEPTALNEIYLRLFPKVWNVGVAVWDVAVNGQAISPTFPANATLLRIPLDKPLPPAAAISFTMAFSATIPVGLGAGNFGEFALDREVLSLGHAYPTVVVYQGRWRLEWPALRGDVLHHDASLYDVRLHAPADLVVAATGTMVDRHDNDDGTVVWRFVGGPMRDFNVVASVRYRSITGQADDVTVTSYYLPGDEVNGRKALGWARDALRYFEGVFGPYPYRKLDVVAMPTPAGGLEYPGLIVISTRYYQDANADENTFESVVVHEVAHQWWYNVVGNDQVNHPWLDEALTQYSTYLYMRAKYGPEGARNFVDTVTNLRWGRVDFKEMPIGLPSGAYTGAEYSAIVYGRGALFFLALADRMGEARMVELVRRYYAAFAWRIAAPEDFKRLAEGVAGGRLDDLFEKWVNPR